MGGAMDLLVRRSIEVQPEYAYYRFYAPTQIATLQNLVRVAGQRWQIEQAFPGRQECGLDHYEVRHWQGWYRHITLSHAGPRSTGHSSRTRRKKLPPVKYHSAFPNCVIC
jgi:hypothetical protein